jgi:hypothetical protein
VKDSGYFSALRNTYQEHHGFTYDAYRISIEEEIKTEIKTKGFFLGIGVRRNLRSVCEVSGTDICE